MCLHHLQMATACIIVIDELAISRTLRVVVCLQKHPKNDVFVSLIILYVDAIRVFVVPYIANFLEGVWLSKICIRC